LPANDTLVLTAKVMSNGQVILPKEMREALGVGSGGHVALVRKDKQVIMMNPVLHAMDVLTERMKGKFEAAGLHTDEDVMELVREIRYELEGIPYESPQAPQTADTVSQAAI